MLITINCNILYCNLLYFNISSFNRTKTGEKTGSLQKLFLNSTACIKFGVSYCNLLPHTMSLISKDIKMPQFPQNKKKIVH